MPKTTAPFLVLDDESGLPISGAAVYMEYQGPREGQLERRGPFHSDQNGRGVISLPKEVFWISWSDNYFAGGYLRTIRVSAPGYDRGGFHEGFNYGAIDQQESFVFRLKPLRNRFGRVLVTAHEPRDDIHLLTIQVLDGPDAGKTIELPVMHLGFPEALSVGNTYYLRQSLDWLHAENERYRTKAWRFDIVLRQGLPDEPFTP
jgi:hypothetical protein